MRLSHTLLLGCLTAILPAQSTSWFEEVRSRHVNAVSQFATTVDVDRDGDLDLVEAGTDELIVERNDGIARFRASRLRIPGLRPGPTTALDADGDGDFDLVAYDGAAAAAILLENDGRGGFLPSRIRTPTIDSRGPYVVADVDSDQRPDLWLPRASGMELWRNAGTAGFVDWTARVPAQRPNATIPIPSAADWDGDGDEDLLFRGGGASVSIIETVSPGVFRLRPTSLITVHGLSSSGDIDGDGRVDLILGTGSTTASPEVAIYRNLGGFRFQAIQGAWLPAQTMPAAAATLVDVDGDSDLDLLLSRTGKPSDLVFGRDQLLLNDRKLRFLQGPDLPAPFGTTGHTHAADYDGDGRIDLLSPSTPVAKLSLGIGNGRFEDASGTALDSVRAALVLTADLERDGQDEILATGSQGVLVLRRSREGTYSLTATIRPQAPLGIIRDIAALDYDGDGDNDLFLATDGVLAASQDRLLRNDGPAGFREVTATDLRMPRTKAYAAVPLDANGDGRMDLFVADRETGARSRLLLSSGGQLVDLPGAIPAGSDGFCAAAADLNGDGRPDLVVSGANTALLLNQGGRFQTFAAGFPAALTLQTISVGDIDGDGDTDLMTTSGRSIFSTGPHQLWINDGRAQFQARSLPSPAGLGMTSGCMLDLDRDGDLDFAACSVVRPLGTPIIQYLENDGQGRFRDISATQHQPRYPVLELSCFDADRDGDPDLLYRRDGAVVVHNMHVDLRVPYRAGPGDRLDVEARAASGQQSPATAVFFIARDLDTRPVRTSFGPYWLDPATSVLWTSGATRNGTATATLTVPPLPSLRGQPLGVQALFVLRNGSSLQLTAAHRIMIRR